MVQEPWLESFYWVITWKLLFSDKMEKNLAQGFFLVLEKWEHFLVGGEVLPLSFQVGKTLKYKQEFLKLLFIFWVLYTESVLLLRYITIIIQYKFQYLRFVYRWQYELWAFSYRVWILNLELGEDFPHFCFPPTKNWVFHAPLFPPLTVDHIVKIRYF